MDSKGAFGCWASTTCGLLGVFLGQLPLVTKSIEVRQTKIESCVGKRAKHSASCFEGLGSLRCSSLLPFGLAETKT